LPERAQALQAFAAYVLMFILPELTVLSSEGDENENMADGRISETVFQVGLIVSLLFYFICFCWFFSRRTYFPIVNLAPHLIAVGLVLSGCIGTVIVLSDAFPTSSTFSGCTQVIHSISFLVYIVLAILSDVILWVCRRDIMTKLTLRNQKSVFGLELINNISHDISRNESKELNTHLPVLLEEFLSNIFTTVSLKKMFWFNNVFYLLVGIGDFVLIIQNSDGKDGVFVHDLDCYDAIWPTAVYKVAFCGFLSVFVLLFFRVIWNLQDNLGVGGVLKSLGIILMFVIGLIIVLIVPQSAEVLLINSRIWGFFFGLVFMPAVYVVLGYYNIYLTYKHQPKAKPKKKKTQKDSDLSDLRSPSKTSDMNSTASDSVGALRVQLEAVFKDPTTRKLLQNFMQHEFSIENFMFVEACSTYENAFDPPTNGEGVGLIGKSIYENFIQDSSPFAVNLPSGIRKNLLNKAKPMLLKKRGRMSNLATSFSGRFSSPAPPSDEKEHSDSHFAHIFTKNLFFEAKEEIMTLITKDTFARFKLSEEYISWSLPASNRSTLLLKARQTFETLIEKV
jgi:hypothetical protein